MVHVGMLNSERHQSIALQLLDVVESTGVLQKQEAMLKEILSDSGEKILRCQNCGLSVKVSLWQDFNLPGHTFVEIDRKIDKKEHNFHEAVEEVLEHIPPFVYSSEAIRHQLEKYKVELTLRQVTAWMQRYMEPVAGERVEMFKKDGVNHWAFNGWYVRNQSK